MPAVSRMIPGDGLASGGSRVSRNHLRLHEIFAALCNLLTPVLAFTADEAWRYSSPGGSIHLQEFDPDP